MQEQQILHFTDKHESMNRHYPRDIHMEPSGEETGRLYYFEKETHEL